jgi:hypothetical protein
MMVICGHLSSQYVGYRWDRADSGNVVHQMLVDYEKLRGEHGFLRLLEFFPDGKTVQVRTFCPITGQIRSPIPRGAAPLRDPKLEEFTFELQTAPGKQARLATSNSATFRRDCADAAENAVPTIGEPIRLDGQGR